MPEKISLEEDNLSVNPAELTSEDRERLDLLFNDIGNDILSFTLDEKGYLQKQQLHAENGKAVQYILGKEAHNNDPNKTLVNINHLHFCASENEAGEIGLLLEEDKITMERDRSSKTRLIELLARIGIPENIQNLKNFALRVIPAPVYDHSDRSRALKHSDALQAMQAMVGILEGVKDDREAYQKAGEIFDGAVQAINSALEHAGLSPITDREILSTAQYRTDLKESFNTRLNTTPPRPHQSSPQRHSFIEFDTDDDFDTDDSLSDSDDDDYGEDDYEEYIYIGYKEGKELEIEARLETLKRLRHEISKEKGLDEEPEEDKAKFLRRHYLEYREDNPSPYTPTLGIEIEIRERSINATGLDNSQKKSEAKEKYRKTVPLGVPAGYDAFWEFAHRPVRYYHTLSKEVAALIEMGLINKSYTKHPLHLTIGGITSRENYKRSEAYVLARALESTMYAVTGARLLRPYLTGASSWAHHSEARGGVLEREPDEIQLEVRTAVEIRTFQLQSITGLDRLLKSAFLLGSALKASQKQESEPLDANEIKLSEAWKTFSDTVTIIFKMFGLKDPREIWLVPGEGEVLNPAMVDKGKSDFIPLAKLLNDAQKDPKSPGAKFVKKIRKAVIDTRKKVKDIIYEKNQANTHSAK